MVSARRTKARKWKETERGISESRRELVMVAEKKVVPLASLLASVCGVAGHIPA